MRRYAEWRSEGLLLEGKRKSKRKLECNLDQQLSPTFKILWTTENISFLIKMGAKRV